MFLFGCCPNTSRAGAATGQLTTGHGQEDSVRGRYGQLVETTAKYMLVFAMCITCIGATTQCKQTTTSSNNSDKDIDNHNHGSTLTITIVAEAAAAAAAGGNSTAQWLSLEESREHCRQ